MIDWRNGACCRISYSVVRGRVLNWFNASESVARVQFKCFSLEVSNSAILLSLFDQLTSFDFHELIRRHRVTILVSFVDNVWQIFSCSLKLVLLLFDQLSEPLLA